jgi:hypothetical protein
MILSRADSVLLRSQAVYQLLKLQGCPDIARCLHDLTKAIIDRAEPFSLLAAVFFAG